MEDSPPSGEDELVEPDQGNGAWKILKNSGYTTDMIYLHSTFAYHFSAAARCRLESGRLADIHPRAPVYAGADHQVRLHPYSSKAAWR